MDQLNIATRSSSLSAAIAANGSTGVLAAVARAIFASDDPDFGMRGVAIVSTSDVFSIDCLASAESPDGDPAMAGVANSVAGTTAPVASGDFGSSGAA